MKGVCNPVRRVRRCVHKAAGPGVGAHCSNLHKPGPQVLELLSATLCASRACAAVRARQRPDGRVWGRVHTNWHGGATRGRGGKCEYVVFLAVYTPKSMKPPKGSHIKFARIALKLTDYMHPDATSMPSCSRSRRMRRRRAPRPSSQARPRSPRAPCRGAVHIHSAPR